MSRKLIGVAMLLALAGTGARAQPPGAANGLYEVVSSGGVMVKALDGNTIRLGKKLKQVLESPVLLSRSNDNQQYYLPPLHSVPGGFCLSGI
jgi:hypothetical protein